MVCFTYNCSYLDSNENQIWKLDFCIRSDKVGATNVGVPVGRVKISLFIGTACAATLFACIQVLDAGSADTMRGTLKELEAIAAAVVGGCLLTGGYGSAIGAAFGALIFGTVSMGIFYTDVDTDWFKVFLGAMMLIAVVFNNYCLLYTSPSPRDS